MLEVIEPGLYSTVQDLGRMGAAALGVRRAGAADAWALQAANLLAGNEPGAPALEMTLLGATFAVRADCLIGLAGADAESHVPDEDRRLRPGQSHRLHAGTTLVCGSTVDGARAYLALGGGIAAEYVLRSASTDPVAGYGGMHGRALQAGDGLVSTRVEPGRERAWPNSPPSSGLADPSVPIAIVPGPQLMSLPDGVREALVGQPWTVTPRSDRVGIRLEGAGLPTGESGELISMPMLPGVIQLPANGQPIVLMPDAPTVGGYPVPALVAEIDHPRMGQLRPGDHVRFEWLDLVEARQRAALAAARLSAAAATLE